MIGASGRSTLIVDFGQPDAFEEHRLADRVRQIALFQRRFGHASERRELVDHAADVADLADDGVDAFVEDLEIVRELAGIAAAQALGGELDRGQRVLDLVGDAARHVGPGAGALRREQVGDVVERDHVALALGHRAFAGQLHLIGAVVRPGADLDLVADLAATRRLGALDDRRQRRNDLADTLRRRAEISSRAEHFGRRAR